MVTQRETARGIVRRVSHRSDNPNANDDNRERSDPPESSHSPSTPAGLWGFRNAGLGFLGGDRL